MAGTKSQLESAAEAFFAELRRVRASGGATGEESRYPALANLLNAVGAALKPKVFCVSELADQGAGRPDFGLYAAKQAQRGKPRPGQAPERGVVEVKSARDDAWVTADGDQVSRYWGRYRLVLVTNTRDFVLVGAGADGRPARLETFRPARSAEEFEARLERPRAFAREAGAALGEYLSRALSHRAALAEPRDLARVEAAGDAPALAAVRTALEEALGARFKGTRGARFFHSTLVQTLFYGVFSAWVLWAHAPPPAEAGRENLRSRASPSSPPVPRIGPSSLHFSWFPGAPAPAGAYAKRNREKTPARPGTLRPAGREGGPGNAGRAAHSARALPAQSPMAETAPFRDGRESASGNCGTGRGPRRRIAPRARRAGRAAIPGRGNSGRTGRTGRPRFRDANDIRQAAHSPIKRLFGRCRKRTMVRPRPPPVRRRSCNAWDGEGRARPADSLSPGAGV